MNIEYFLLNAVFECNLTRTWHGGMAWLTRLKDQYPGAIDEQQNAEAELHRITKGSNIIKIIV